MASRPRLSICLPHGPQWYHLWIRPPLTAIITRGINTPHSISHPLPTRHRRTLIPRRASSRSHTSSSKRRIRRRTVHLLRNRTRPRQRPITQVTRRLQPDASSSLQIARRHGLRRTAGPFLRSRRINRARGPHRRPTNRRRRHRNLPCRRNRHGAPSMETRAKARQQPRPLWPPRRPRGPPRHHRSSNPRRSITYTAMIPASLRMTLALLRRRRTSTRTRTRTRSADSTHRHRRELPSHRTAGTRVLPGRGRDSHRRATPARREVTHREGTTHAARLRSRRRTRRPGRTRGRCSCVAVETRGICRDSCDRTTSTGARHRTHIGGLKKMVAYVCPFMAWASSGSRNAIGERVRVQLLRYFELIMWEVDGMSS
jgi:hypothetical protein